MTKRLLIIDCSKYSGGQIEYAKRISNTLRENGFVVNLKQARSLSEFKKIIKDKKNHEQIVLNGLRSLYFYSVVRSLSSRVFYIQHTDWRDLQAGYLRLILRIIFVHINLLVRDISIVAVHRLERKLFDPRSDIFLPCPLIRRENKKKNFNLPLRDCLFIGLLNNNKDPTYAIKECLGANKRLEVCGSGELLTDISEFYQPEIELGNLVMSGWVDDTSRALISSDCLIVCSEYEAMPVVVLDALSLGIPVLIADHLRSIVDDPTLEKYVTRFPKVPGGLISAFDRVVMPDQEEFLLEWTMMVRVGVRKFES